jgi:conjugative transposon TraN protein
MKCKCVFLESIVLLLIALQSLAQNEDYSFIPSAHLSITYNKTTNLIFPFSVQSIDRGSKDILVQQPKGTQNVVQIKADKPDFTQTNLSIITIDGKLYSFTVDYTAQPSQLNIIIGKQNLSTSDSTFKHAVMLSSGNNEVLMQAVAQKFLSAKDVPGKKNKHNQMELRLNGIYINHDILYFRLQLKNKSNLSYDLDAITFILKDSQKSKRAATQEIELQPIYNYGSFKTVQGKSSASCIIALPKFTLPDAKYLSVQVLEKNGGRDLHLRLGNRHIMQAKIISAL